MENRRHEMTVSRLDLWVLVVSKKEEEKNNPKPTQRTTPGVEPRGSGSNDSEDTSHRRAGLG